jgi:protein tyrosine phosphatase type 4A
MARSNNNLPNPVSLVECGAYRFLIFDAPNDDNLPMYITEFQKHNVTNIVRACDPTYSVEPLRAVNITVNDMPFVDGGVPPDDVVNKWLNLLKVAFKEGTTTKDTVGVHCVAGLGRAPVLVAIALIEGGMNPLETVNFIRERRRGAFNIKQIQWLKGYKPRLKKKNNGCIVM